MTKNSIFVCIYKDNSKNRRATKMLLTIMDLVLSMEGFIYKAYRLKLLRYFSSSLNTNQRVKKHPLNVK